MRLALVVTLALTLSACATVGRKVTQQQLSEFTEGKTTYQEVINKLGKPTNSTVNSDGTRLITYSYVQSQMTKESYIPIVGGFLRGSETESTYAMLQFDKHGVLTQYTSNEGQTSTGTGLISGQRQ